MRKLSELVWLSNTGMLGASPDGLIRDCVVEVKCRYKSRAILLSEDLSTDKSYIIWYNTMSKLWEVNEEHDYYHQIQGQMHLTNRNGCYLVVWTPIETALVYIEKKCSWTSWINQMEAFYLEHFVPYLQQHFVNKS